MAKIKPYKGSAKLDACLGTLDVIGMTDIPVVSQLAEAGSAVGSLVTGDYIGAALSVGSMLPIAGKACEFAKGTRRAQHLVDATVDIAKSADKVADTAKAVGKNTGLGNLTVTQKLKELEKSTAQVVEKSTSKPSSVPKAKPAPAATQAKSPKIDGPKEVQSQGRTFDTGSTNNIDLGKWRQYQEDLAATKPNNRGITHQNYGGYQSNPATTHVFWNTAKSYPFKKIG